MIIRVISVDYYRHRERLIMVSVESITICIRFQTTVDGVSSNIFVKARPSTTASKIKASISHSRFDDDPIFLTADLREVQDNEMLDSFKDCNLYAGLA